VRGAEASRLWSKEHVAADTLQIIFKISSDLS